MTASKATYNYLLAFDGSKHSFAAVEYLCDLGSSSTSTRNIVVHLLTVFTPRQIKDHHILNERLMHVKRYLEDKQNLTVSTNLLLGYPSEKILEFVDEIKPDLIFMGAKGLRATLGILLGGLAQQVVEYACCPVFIARAPYKKLARVLLAIDGSIYNKQAVSYFKRLGLPGRIETVVMHVLPPLPVESLPASATEMWLVIGDQIPFPTTSSEQTAEETAWLEEEEKQGSALLDWAVSELRSADSEPERVLVRGDAATEILEYSSNNDIDLIFAGSRGLSQLRGFFVGSVSRKLVHYANCSVLIVKSPTAGTN